VKMKKYLGYLLIMIILILPLLSCIQTSNPGRSHEVETSLLLSKVVSDGKLLYEYSYDSNDHLVSLQRFLYQDDSYMEFNEYNQNGLLEKRSIIDPYGGSTEYYEYNREGLVTSVTKHYPSGNIFKEEYRYNSKGRVIEGLTFLNEEKLGYITYKYDEEGSTIERKEYNKDNYLMSELRFEYDNHRNPYPLNFPLDIVKKNNVVYSYYFHSVMSYPPPEYSSTFKYNSAGLPIKETRVSSNSREPQSIEYIYMSKGVQ
jgi:hypothetical protein